MRIYVLRLLFALIDDSFPFFLSCARFVSEIEIESCSVVWLLFLIRGHVYSFVWCLLVVFVANIFSIPTLFSLSRPVTIYKNLSNFLCSGSCSHSPIAPIARKHFRSLIYVSKMVHSDTHTHKLIYIHFSFRAFLCNFEYLLFRSFVRISVTGCRFDYLTYFVITE